MRRIKTWAIALFALCSATALWAQKNPNEPQLLNEINGLKQQLVKIDTTIERGSSKGKFSGIASDSLYKIQDYIMDLNDRLYWMTNKDSLLHVMGDREVPTEEQKGMDGDSDPIGEEIDSLPPAPVMPDFDLGSLMPKPKVKKYSYFFQFQNGASFMLGNTRGGAGINAPEWQTKLATNQGGTAIYALRLGKADVSKLKMEFNLKKKFTTSNFLKASPLQLRIGLGLQRYEVAQKVDYEINLKANSVEFSSQNLDYQKNTLAVYYVHVPVTVWRKLTDKSFIEVGGFVDILRKSTQTVTYKKDEIANSLTRKGNFGINEIAYGATATIGGNALALYVNYHLSSLFAKNDTYNFNLMSIGIKAGY